MRRQIRFGFVLIFAGAMAFAQGVPAPAAAPAPPAPAAVPGVPPPPAPPAHAAPPVPRAHRPPMERALHGGAGRWWQNPEMAQRLGLTEDQQKRMDDVFQQYRLKLIDLSASLQKEEAVLEPLMAAPLGDEGKITAQIDRVAQARAELEKSNARMLLGVRRVLTQDQWKKLQEPGPPRPQRND